MKLKNFIFIVILALLGNFAGLGNQFALDDIPRIVENEQVWAGTAAEIFFERTFPGDLYRPLPTISFALTYALFELDPLPFHLGNIILHILVAYLLFLLLESLFEERRALFIAALFAVHPIHTEAVANISNRSELMAAAFVLLALLLWVRARKAEPGLFTSPALAGLSFFAVVLFALLSKESAFCLFLLLPLVCMLQKTAVTKLQRVFALCGLAAAAVYFACRYKALGSFVSSALQPDLLDNPLQFATLNDRVFSGIWLLGKYICLSIVPWPLSSDYSYAKLDVLQPVFSIAFLMPLLAISLMIAAAFVGFFHSRRLAFWGAWFFACFAVSSNIIFPIGTIFAERLAYLPSIAICGLLAEAMLYLSSRRVSAALLIVFCGVFALIGNYYSQSWYDNDTLHSREIVFSPASARAQCNYGFVLRNRGDYQAAMRHFQKAIEIYPAFDRAAYGIGSLFLATGEDPGAVHWYRRALSMNPNNFLALRELAAIRSKQGRLREAEELYIRAMSFNNSDRLALYGLARVLLELKDVENLKKVLSELRRLQFDAQKLSELRRELQALSTESSEVN